MCNHSELFQIAPWNTIEVFNKFAMQLKEELPLSRESIIIAAGTSAYENVLRELWEDYKHNPTKLAAEKFIEAVKDYSRDKWRVVLKDLLDLEDLSDLQEAYLQEELSKHYGFLDNSLLPDIVRGIDRGLDDFSNMDYRVIFLYAGAFWSFGFLSTIMWDGLDYRDLADLFVFIGPNDESTCTGPRGCQQYVNKEINVGLILLEDIIPGHLRCLTNCRHMYLPSLNLIPSEVL